MNKSFRPYYGISIICACFLVLCILSLNQMIIYTPDSARYLIWANSLARLEGFKDATNPEPTHYVVHAPLYPVLLSPSAFFFPNSVVAAKAVTSLFGCAAILLLYIWLRRKVDDKYALLGSVLLAVNPLMMIYSTQILSDVLFAVCIILFFLLAEKLIDKEGQNSGKIEFAFITVIVAGIFLREVGLTLVIGATAFFLWKKQYRRAIRVFLVSLLYYLLWFIRNDVIVAGFENQAKRNTNVFFTHLFTPIQASLFEEFGSRLWSNLNVYKDFIGKILLMPDFAHRSNSLISTSDPFVVVVLKVLPVAQFVLIGAAMGFLAAGLWYELKRSKNFAFIVVFFICYCGPIIFYPINDIRFLFPLAVAMIYFTVIGVKQILDWCRRVLKHKALYYLTAGSLSLLILPNIIWVQSYVRNNWIYARSSEKFFANLQNDPVYPELFAKPLHLAAKWIVQNSDSSAVIVSRWKELGIWLEGRKLVENNPQTLSDLFDYNLRDYKVKYVVSLSSWAGISEFESLFIKSQRFAFVPVYRIANVEVYEVRRKGLTCGRENAAAPDSTNRAVFQKALLLLEDDPLQAEHLLNELVLKMGPYGTLTFHIGVAKEFSGELDSAETYFKKFRSVSQAGSYILQAWYHQDIIERIKMAAASESLKERAERFHDVAVNYWEIGYRKQAIRMLHRSIELDSNFFPARITLSIFSLIVGDTVNAQKDIQLASSLEPANPLVTSMTTILRCSDLLKSGSYTKQIELRLEIVNAYITMGLRENAVDELLKILQKDPNNRTALRLLAESYEMKNRYAPAFEIYKRLDILNPSNPVVTRKLHELSLRLQ